MKQQKSEQKPDLKETGGKRRLRRNSDEFRRKTRSQALREKKVKAVLSSVEFSEVSIETLHSICAPAVSQQASNPYLKKLACLIRRQPLPQETSLPRNKAKKSLQKQQPNKSTNRRSSDHLNNFGIAPYGLLLSSKPYSFHTSQAHIPEESRLQSDSYNQGADPQRSPHSSNVADNLPSEDTWLEVFVEIDDGIDLVVDLDSNGFADWFLERNSSILVHPNIADESRKQCDTDSHTSEVACFGSSDTEVPSTNMTAHDNKLTTFCIAADGDTGSQTAQMGIFTGCVPSCKLAEVMDSQESFNSQVKEPQIQGFNFGSLERMPTFLAIRPSAEESKINCNSGGLHWGLIEW